MVVGEGVLVGEGVVVGDGVWVGVGLGLGVVLGVALGVGEGVGDDTTTDGPIVYPSNDGTGNDSGVWPAIAVVMKSCQIAAGIVPP